MSDVTFNEEPRYVSSHPQEEAKPGSIIGLMYKLGIAKTKKDANVVMSGIIVVCIIVSATMLVFVQPHADAAQQAQLQQDLARMNAYQNQHPSH